MCGVDEWVLRMSFDLEIFDVLIDMVCWFVSEWLWLSEVVVVEVDVIFVDFEVEMKELGLFGLLIDFEYGGFGLLMFEEIKVVIELGKILFVM